MCDGGTGSSLLPQQHIPITKVKTEDGSHRLLTKCHIARALKTRKSGNLLDLPNIKQVVFSLKRDTAHILV